MLTHCESYFEKATPLVYNDSKCKLLGCTIIYSKCVLLNNILMFDNLCKIE